MKMAYSYASTQHIYMHYAYLIIEFGILFVFSFDALRSTIDCSGGGDGGRKMSSNEKKKMESILAFSSLSLRISRDPE